MLTLGASSEEEGSRLIFHNGLVAASLESHFKTYQGFALTLRKGSAEGGYTDGHGNGHIVVSQTYLTDLVEYIELVLNAGEHTLTGKQEHILMLVVFLYDTAEALCPILENGICLSRLSLIADLSILSDLVQIVDHDIGNGCVKGAVGIAEGLELGDVVEHQEIEGLTL